VWITIVDCIILFLPAIVVIALTSHLRCPARNERTASQANAPARLGDHGIGLYSRFNTHVVAPRRQVTRYTCRVPQDGRTSDAVGPQHPFGSIANTGSGESEGHPVHQGGSAPRTALDLVTLEVLGRSADWNSPGCGRAHSPHRAAAGNRRCLCRGSTCMEWYARRDGKNRHSAMPAHSPRR
jgi:hypothetical protein